MRIPLFLGCLALVAGAACSSSSSDSRENESDAGEANDASPNPIDASNDSGAPNDSGAAEDSATPTDAGSDAGAITATFEAPDGGCNFESIATEVSAGSNACSKNILESCSGAQFVLECDCTTNLCSCMDDDLGTTYATFTPAAALCADATQTDGGCSSVTGLEDDAKTHCGIY